MEGYVMLFLSKLLSTDWPLAFEGESLFSTLLVAQSFYNSYLRALRIELNMCKPSCNKMSPHTLHWSSPYVINQEIKWLG